MAQIGVGAGAPRDAGVLHAESAHRTSGFDALRLVAALAVVVGHAWPLTGRHPSPHLGGMPLFTVAVEVFFATSGFLILRSWQSDPRPAAFLARRALRIFPALAAVIGVTVFLIGPAVTSEVGRDYFRDPLTLRYVLGVTLVPGYALPGVFDDHPLAVVNGSLWTLGPEFLCYLGVVLLGVLVRGRGTTLSRRARRLTAVAAAAVWLGCAALTAIPAAHTVGFASPTATAVGYFAGGALLAALSTRSLPRWPAVPLLAVWCAATILAPATPTPGAGAVIASLAVPYLAVVAGQSTSRVAAQATRFGDLSYGVYLWGFPIQQLVIEAFGILPLWLDLLITAPLTMLVAAMSWRLVEAPALARKPERSVSVSGRAGLVTRAGST